MILLEVYETYLFNLGDKTSRPNLARKFFFDLTRFFVNRFGLLVSEIVKNGNRYKTGNKKFSYKKCSGKNWSNRAIQASRVGAISKMYADYCDLTEFFEFTFESIFVSYNFADF